MAIINFVQFAKKEGTSKLIKDFSSSVIINKDKKTNKGEFLTFAGCDEGSTKDGKKMLHSFIDTRKICEAFRNDEYFRTHSGLSERQIKILESLD